MKRIDNNIPKEFQAPILLLIIAVFLIVPVFVTQRTDLPAATMVVASCACFFGALFLMVTRADEGVPSDVAASFATGLMISYAQVAAELGASGPAHFVPEGTGVVQFNPAGEIESVPKRSRTVIVAEPQNGGIFSVPAGMPVMDQMTAAGKLRVPQELPDICSAVAEAERDLMHAAAEVQVTEEGDSVVVRFREFRFMPACVAVGSESLKICEIAPCPPCSLAGCMLAAGTQMVWKIEGVSPSPETGEMTVTFCRMLDAHPPRGAGPDTTH